MIWDTGSSKCWIPLTSCTNCTGKKYNFAPSLSAGTYSTVDSASVTTTYADGSSFTGNAVQDTVCVTADPLSCAPNIKWYGITSESGIPASFDGVVGLSMTSDTAIVPIVKQLHTSGLITEAKFSFALASNGGTSYLDFGPIDPSQMADASDLVKIKVPTSTGTYGYWWHAQVTGVMFSDDRSTEYSTPSLPGILDTGSSCLSIPSNEFLLIVNKLVGLLSSYSVDAFGKYVFSCTANEGRLIPFFVKLGDYWL